MLKITSVVLFVLLLTVSFLFYQERQVNNVLHLDVNTFKKKSLELNENILVLQEKLTTCENITIEQHTKEYLQEQSNDVNKAVKQLKHKGEKVVVGILRELGNTFNEMLVLKDSKEEENETDSVNDSVKYLKYATEKVIISILKELGETFSKMLNKDNEEKSSTESGSI